MTNSERRISRQRPFLPPPGETKADWWIVAEVAKRLGYQGFDWDGPAAVFREHAALSAFENQGSRDFDLGGLAALDDAGFDALTPVQWPVRDASDLGDKRFFAEGGFFTPDRKGRFIAPAPVHLSETATEAFPLLLNTGRIRDQWHTMTRTADHQGLPCILWNPSLRSIQDDAARFQLESNHHARVRSAHGEALLAVKLDDGLLPERSSLPSIGLMQRQAMPASGGLFSPMLTPFPASPT